jgi:hypothetical protein
MPPFLQTCGAPTHGFETFSPPPPPPALATFRGLNLATTDGDDDGDYEEDEGDEGGFGRYSGNPFDNKYRNVVIPDTSESICMRSRYKLHTFILRQMVKNLKEATVPLKILSTPQEISKKAIVSSLRHVVSKTIADWRQYRA